MAAGARRTRLATERLVPPPRLASTNLSPDCTIRVQVVCFSSRNIASEAANGGVYRYDYTRAAQPGRATCNPPAPAPDTSHSSAGVIFWNLVFFDETFCTALGGTETTKRMALDGLSRIMRLEGVLLRCFFLLFFMLLRLVDVHSLRATGYGGGAARRREEEQGVSILGGGNPPWLRARISRRGRGRTGLKAITQGESHDEERGREELPFILAVG